MNKNLLKDSGFDIETLENSTDVIYAISDTFDLIYFNPSWFKFASENNAKELLKTEKFLKENIVTFLPDVLKDFYLDNYKQVLSTNKKWQHQFECSSSEIYRLYNHTAYPFKNKKGILFVNRIRTKEPINKTDHLAKLNYYMHPSGFIHQCSNCRSIQRVDDENKWEWVSEWVNNMPKKTSHTICPTCFDYYWKNG